MESREHRKPVRIITITSPGDLSGWCRKAYNRGERKGVDAYREYDPNFGLTDLFYFLSRPRCFTKGLMSGYGREMIKDREKHDE